MGMRVAPHARRLRQGPNHFYESAASEPIIWEKAIPPAKRSTNRKHICD